MWVMTRALPQAGIVGPLAHYIPNRTTVFFSRLTLQIKTPGRKAQHNIPIHCYIPH